jgi:hypothetical protein
MRGFGVIWIRRVHDLADYKRKILEARPFAGLFLLISHKGSDLRRQVGDLSTGSVPDHRPALLLPHQFVGAAVPAGL